MASKRKRWVGKTQALLPRERKHWDGKPCVPAKGSAGMVRRAPPQKEALYALLPLEKEALAWEAVLMYEESL